MFNNCGYLLFIWIYFCVYSFDLSYFNVYVVLTFFYLLFCLCAAAAIEFLLWESIKEYLIL